MGWLTSILAALVMAVFGFVANEVRKRRNENAEAELENAKGAIEAYRFKSSGKRVELRVARKGAVLSRPDPDAGGGPGPGDVSGE